ncbi:MAG: zinc ribbon domain-containing protein [Anaerolineaceae bacterium]|nr:MAG: zinc ribbon domain-containing protein [Anaerolineaceae bacterium]
MQNMKRRFFHGKITPVDVAQILLAEFNRTNTHTQTFGTRDKMFVQIGTRPGAPSGGQTALTVTIESAPDGVMIEMGQQAWMGTAASLGWSAFTALRNPLGLLSRIDDIAQDLENLQLPENVWRTVERAAEAVGASHELSERFKRVTCEYCGAATPVGDATCLACGAPLGKSQPTSCRSCGFVILRGETICPNCGKQI